MDDWTKKKAIIIGASSGIGKALSYELSKKGCTLGLIARRKELLEDLKKDLPTPSYIKKIDITTDHAEKKLFDLIEEMNGVDLIFVNAGIGFSDSNLEWQEESFNWEKEYQTIKTNVEGFTRMTLAAYHYFIKRKKGHIIATSSIVSFIPNSLTPAYSASKAFVSMYMDGLSIHAYKSNLPIHFTTLLPGWVDTPMIVRNKKMFWVASASLAAKQIREAIEKKKKIAYITKRWGVIPFLLKLIPHSLYKKVF